jgi:acetoacetate decarboxylase
MGYPPSPWQLRGQLHLSLWLPPATEVPRLPAAVGSAARLITVAGRAIVGTAWVDYQPGSVLEYRELLAAVAVRRGLRPAVTITHIWVDNESSRDGGRELWGIPKDLATLAIDHTSSAQGLAEAVIEVGRQALGRWPFRFSLIQDLGGRAKVSPVRGSARLHRARIGWDVVKDGPLSWLARARPLVSLSFHDFRLRFGGDR